MGTERLGAPRIATFVETGLSKLLRGGPAAATELARGERSRKPTRLTGPVLRAVHHTSVGIPADESPEAEADHRQL